MDNYRKYFWRFVIPSLIPFALVIVIPFALGVMFSFTDWRGAYVQDWWVGLRNYKNVFGQEEFLNSFWLTVKFTFISVVIVNIVAFTLALLVTKGFKGSKIFRTVFFMPNLIGGLILGYIWKFIFDVLFDNILFELTNMQFFRHWLQDPDMAFWALVILAVWQLAGYMMIIYIAAIQNIPEEIIESSHVEGANYWQQLRKIVIPSVNYAFTITFFLTLSYCFKYLDPNIALTNGGPGKSTELLALHILRTGQEYGKYGLAQAEAIIFFLLIGTVTILQVYLSKKREVEA